MSLKPTGRWSPGHLDPPPTEREMAIVETAMSTPAELPEPFAAARMFFRFDPAFRSELEQARYDWRGSIDPLQLDGLSEERQFDFQARLRNNKKIRTLAYGLAARWALEVESVVRAIAFDDPPTYPSVLIKPSTREPDTGFRYVEVRVYSAFVWNAVDQVLDNIDWLPRHRDVVWLEDRPEGSRYRLRGMKRGVVTRILALHFLVDDPKGPRATGGIRSWNDATGLWRDAEGDEHSKTDLEDPRHWRLGRGRVLRGIFGRMPKTSDALAAIQEERHLSDPEWAALLGIDRDTWYRIQLDQPVPRAAWESVKGAIPAIAGDLQTLLQIGLLRTRAR